jgi:dipeptidyl aminopeptidase/acylaminoacyl peptidase
MDAGFPISAAMIARSAVVAEPRWSPDGQWLGWLRVDGGRADLWVMPADGSGAPAVVTADAPVTPAGAYGGGAWCWVGSEALAVVGPDGSLAAVPRAGGQVTAVSREGKASAPAASPDGSAIAFALESADACDIHVVPVDGPTTPVRVSSADYAWDPTWSPDGDRIAWHEWDLAQMSWDTSRIVVAAPDGAGARVFAGGGDVAVGQPRFSPDGASLAYVSDESGWWNVWVADAGTGERRPVLAEAHDHAEPSWGPGQRSFAWSPDGASLAINRNELGFGRLVVAPVDGGPTTEVSRGWHDGIDWGPAGVVATRSGSRTPSTVTVLAPDGSGRRSVARGPVGGFEASGLGEPEPVSWRSDDDETVHGHLLRPAVSAFGPSAFPPLLVDLHGGPTGQATVGWKPFHHYFVTRGWAVLTPDPRGSTGYGRAYRTALDGRWGELDVIDVAAGIRAAVDDGWCAPGRVAVCGGSSGGMTALLVAAHHPGLVRAAVSMYGVTDLFDLAGTTHRFESRYLDRIVGELPRDADRYRDRSPVTQAGAIRCPLLVLQGSADQVVPPAQARALVDAVRAAGGTVEHHEYEGEGHGWSATATVLDVYERTEAFLARNVLAAGEAGP